MSRIHFRVLWVPLFLLLAFCLGSAQAAYNLRYSTITAGAMTFTGNTIGLDKAAGANTPGTSGAIGGYIADGVATAYNTYPVGTTGTWTLNKSSAVLRIPATATVLYAELIWGGSYSYGGDFRTLAERNGAVNFITPLGTNSISPDPATATDLGTIVGGGGTCNGSPPCFYVRSANVTSLVQALGAGNIPISVGAIPATIGASENNLNNGGWTLAVAYSDPTKVENKMNIYVGSEFVYNGMPGNGSTAQVTNFCTAPSGAQSGRLLVSAMEGDSGIAGDEFHFGGTNPAPVANKLFGPKNLTGNFFVSQINDDNGNNDTAGSFGSSNQTPGTAGIGRQGYDITNVALGSFLTAGQTTAYATATTTGDTYVINSLGIQIKVGQPSFPTAVKTVDKTVAKLGDTLTYTITLDNSTGTASATSVKFFDTLPAGLTYVAGSFTQGGVSVPAADPTNAAGVSLPDIATGSSLVVSFKAQVASVPVSPAAASYVNSARWTYQYQPCAGQPVINAQKITNSVTTTIARMAVTKTVAPASGAQMPGTTLTYTIAMQNNGLADSAGATLADAIPAGTTYVASSTQLNGTAVADVSGAMPYATAAQVNSAGQAAGVITAGATATVTFQVKINTAATGTITNTASADIDGAGGQAPATATASTTVQPTANVSITKTNGVSTMISGTATTYTITVNNAGPAAADNTVVQDPAVTGLSCTAVTCPAAGLTGGAVCPATLTMAALQGAGLTIPTLPSGSSVQLQVACTVTATGS